MNENTELLTCAQCGFFSRTLADFQVTPELFHCPSCAAHATTLAQLQSATPVEEGDGK